MNDIECNQSHSPALSWRSYHAPVIPARIQSFLWNLVEFFLAESSAKIAILGTIYSSGIEPFWN